MKPTSMVFKKNVVTLYVISDTKVFATEDSWQAE